MVHSESGDWHLRLPGLIGFVIVYIVARCLVLAQTSRLRAPKATSRTIRS